MHCPPPTPQGPASFVSENLMKSIFFKVRTLPFCAQPLRGCWLLAVKNVCALKGKCHLPALCTELAFCLKTGSCIKPQCLPRNAPQSVECLFSGRAHNSLRCTWTLCFPVNSHIANSETFMLGSYHLSVLTPSGESLFNFLSNVTDTSSKSFFFFSKDWNSD